MRRIDALISTFMPDALNGDSNAATVCLRYMQHRANLLGWGTKDHAAKLTITDGAGGGEPRKLEIEFVLPGSRITGMADRDHRGVPQSSHAPWTPSSSLRIPASEMEEELARNEELKRKLQIDPDPGDIVIEKDIPSSMKKTYGGYDQE
jgi:hypothetical protein